MEYEICESNLKYKGTISFNVDAYTLIFSADKVGVCFDGGYKEIPSDVFPELQELCAEIEELTQEIQDADTLDEPEEDEFDSEEEFEQAFEEWENAKEQLDDLEYTNESFVESSVTAFLEDNLEQLMSFVTTVTL